MTKGGGKPYHKGNAKGFHRRVPKRTGPLMLGSLNEATMDPVRDDMNYDDLVDVVTVFDKGYRRRNPNVEEKRLDIEEVYHSNGSVSLSDVWLHLYNPARGNYPYGWEDVEGETHFLNMREIWHNADVLQRGTEYYQMIPREAQLLCNVVDRYDGFDIEKTSCLIIRKIGNPSFGLGFNNEEDWAPRILTCLGLFTYGFYGVVASQYVYHYPKRSIANEACFIGEMRLTLANRDLAEFYHHVLSGEYYNEGVCINENRIPIVVDYAGYALTGKDMTERVDCARVDKDIWMFPRQFDASGRFITNGPGTRVIEDSPFIL